MFDQITLPNGLRVVGERLTHVRSCTVGVWVKVGSMNERPEENGLSHFIEHMVFKGTKNRTARDIAEEMDMAGGQLNAFTSKECTCYYAKVTDDELPLAVDILADLALRPTFDEGELNKERGVVLEEIAMVEDTPEDLVHELLSDAQYSGSLRRPILGTNGLIRRYGRSDLVGYWERHYIPENMVLAIAGNYDWNAFLELVGTYFDVFPNQSTGQAQLEEQAFVSGRKARDKDTEQLHICMGFPGVPSDSDELYALSVFSNALGGGMSSRLFQRIREELGMAYSVYTYSSSYQGLGSFNVYAGTTPENGETVIREMQEQMALFLEKGLSDKEFRSAKAQLRGGYVLGLESSSGRMQSIGRGMLLHNRLRDSEETLSKIDAVTMDSVMEIARRVLSAAPSAAIVGKGAQRHLEKIGGAQVG
ncbi:MAG: insulinase family protein [Clostridiales bacterium]|nr:insulinase family protein [Clostridiales bacterium]MDO4350207.1 pitrilysin family protein [Eubacteriales bacterium]MDY4008506.1 pitrilysin family protein [Candidatus Limiplasma sp.]